MFRNKEYIYCVYKEQSFSKAAEKLHVSPPALSAMVKRIETQLGTPIFDRKTSPISLTSFGAEYIKNVEIINELENRMMNMNYEFQTLQIGQLSICASNLSSDYVIAEIIAHFKEQYPHVCLNVIGANTLRSKQMLDSREVDFFITSRPLDSANYESILMAKEQLILLVPQKFPINQAFLSHRLTPETLSCLFDDQIKSVRLSQFKELPFILNNSGNYLRICTDTLFREAQFEPNIVLEVEETSVGLNFAKYGIGATICSNLLVERADFEKYFCLYKLDSRYSHRNIHAYYRAGTYVTPAMERFLELAEYRQ